MQQLYRGYVKIVEVIDENGNSIKTPAKGESFKNNAKLKSLEEVQNFDGYAGVLNDDVVLIDIDDEIQSEKLMNIVEERQLNCRVYKTTRGMHFLFKNYTKAVKKCGSHLTAACGFHIDVKVGLTPSLEILKFKGVERFIIWDIEDGSEYQELPKWLRPVYKVSTDFIGMKNGDGRNQSLFNYILTLQSCGFSRDETRECIQLMNEHVLDDPLSEREINTVLRDEAFKEDLFFVNNQFQHHTFADWLISDYNIVRINGGIFVYDDGVYVNARRRIEKKMIEKLPFLKQFQRTEVWSYIDTKIDENTVTDDTKYIAFANGVYNLETGELGEFTPNIIITNKIKYNYNPNAYDELTDKALNRWACDDPSIRALLEEAIGYPLFRRNELRTAFFLIGDKRNGKSTFLDVLGNLYTGHTWNASLEELQDKYNIAEIADKLVNIGDDIDSEYISDLSKFRKLVSGSPVNARQIYERPINFVPFTKFYFSLNEFFRTKSKGLSANLDRMVIIPFDAKFSVEDPDFDPFIKTKLCCKEAVEYQILLGLRGLRRLLQNRQFTISERVEKQKETFEISNNPVLSFFADIDKAAIINQPTKDVFTKYREFCIADGHQPMSRIEFSKVVNKHFGTAVKVVRFNNTVHRTFIIED